MLNNNNIRNREKYWQMRINKRNHHNNIQRETIKKINEYRVQRADIPVSNNTLVNLMMVVMEIAMAMKKILLFWFKVKLEFVSANK